MKKPRRLHGDVLFYIEGGHLLKVNWFAQTLIKIDHKVCKAIQLSRSVNLKFLKTRKDYSRRKIVMKFSFVL